MKVSGRDSLATIVGIVGHVKQYGLDRSSGGQIYMSQIQFPWRWMNLAVRTTGDPAAFARTARTVIASLDPGLAMYGVATMASSWPSRRTDAASCSAVGMVAGVEIVCGGLAVRSDSVSGPAPPRDRIASRSAAPSRHRTVCFGRVPR